MNRDINKIIFSKYIWRNKKPIKNIKENLGWDTETIKGKLIVLSNSDKKSWVKGLDFIDIEDFLWVLTQKEYNNKINWFYNLSYDTNSILTYLEKDNLLEIIKLGVTDYKGYRIKIIPQKELSISRLKKDKYNKDEYHAYQTSKFFDMAVMYDYAKLSDLALKYTTYKKVDVSDINDLNLLKIINDQSYREHIKKRCVYDCLILKELADIFTEKVYKIIKTNNFRSKASFSREYVLTNIDKKINLPNKKMIEYALKSYHGGMIETLKLGNFKNVYEYDLNSAYPSAIKDLYNMEGNNKTNRSNEPDASYSFYVIFINYSNPFISPFYNVHKNHVYHSNGDFKIVINKDEIEFLIDKGFDFKILHAVHLMKNKRTEKPFKNIVTDLYDMRMAARSEGDHHLEKTIKFILNSIYGVTINTYKKLEVINNIVDNEGKLTPEYIDNIDTIKDEMSDSYKKEKDKIIEYKINHIATNMYNPLFADYITKNCKTTIFNNFWEAFNKNKIISINTDGVYSINKIHHIKPSKELGGWGLDLFDNILMIGNGRYFNINKKGEVLEKGSARRGLIGSSLEVYNEILLNKNKDCISLEKDHVIKLKESFIRNEYKGKLNQFVKATKYMYAKNNKRFWFDEINNFSDILEGIIESRPFYNSEIKEI